MGTERKYHLAVSFPPLEPTESTQLSGAGICPSVKVLMKTKMLSDNSIRYQVSNVALKGERERATRGSL